MKKHLKRIIVSVLMASMMFSMSASVFASEDITIRPIDYSTEYITESDAQPIDGITTPNPEGVTPYIDSDGSWSFTYFSQSGGGAGHILTSDSFTVTNTTSRISLCVKAKNTSDEGKNMTITLKGKGCGLFGKKVQHKADGKWAGFDFTGLTVGETYKFDLNSTFYCSGDGTISNFGKVV